MSRAKAARFRSDAGFSLASAMFARGVIFVLQVLVARRLGVAELNLFVTAGVVGATVYLASDLGLRPASLFIAKGDPGVCRSIVHRHHRIRGLSALAGLVIGAPVVAILARASWPSALTAALLVVSYVVQSYSRYLRAPLRAAAKVRTETRIETIEKLTMLVSGLVGLAFRSLLVLGLGQLLGALVGLVLTHRRLPGGSAPIIEIRGSVVRYGLTLAAATGAPMLYSRLDYLVLVRMGSASGAAVYAASYSILLGASLLPIALGEAAIAHLGEGHEGRRRYLRLAFATGVAGAAAMVAVGPVVVRGVFGFHDGRLGRLFVVLAAAFMVMTWNSTIGILAPSSGRQKLLLKITASASVVSLTLAVVLVHRYGMVGAGLSTLLTECYVGLAWLGLGRQAPGRSSDFSGGTDVPMIVLAP